MSRGEGASSVINSLFHRGSTMDQGSMDDSSSIKGGSASGFTNSPERTMSQSFSQTKNSKRESYKAQKKTYRSQKKEAAKELLSTITDPSVVLLGDWLKVRGTLKSWTKLWCVLKPGVLILYKSDKQKKSQWVGTILLNTCELLERPSKKDGFCFKLFHPLDQSIWATKGPKGETIGAFVQPLPYSYCIFRAPSEAAGKCWMDALELALKCTSLLKRSMTRLDTSTEVPDMDTELTRKQIEYHESKSAAAAGSDDYNVGANGNDDVDTEQTGHQYDSLHQQENQMNESDLERHFANQAFYWISELLGTNANSCLGYNNNGLEEDKSERDDSDTTQSEFDVEPLPNHNLNPPVETHYEENRTEELGASGDTTQTEEVADENKSLIWTLVKQVRPGMDLSKVVLPTFILEPRSFLDKLSDYYYHADILSEAVLQESPYMRMKYVIRWYLSGFYKKPKGLKKPYNPVIGECFRCYWYHPQTGSRTFYIAEQVSHHPPISVFHVTNRRDGFNISGSILARSKFYGNSLSAILDGVATLTFLERGEDYFITMPFAHCKGILIGTLTMELGGKVTIDCPKSGYKCELEFKLKPFLGSGQASNKIHGKITMGADTLALLDGHWDQEIYIKDRTVRRRDVFWNPTQEVRATRLKRFTVPVPEQYEFESERLWEPVSKAILAADMQTATAEKYRIEEEQRLEARERKQKNEEWVPRFFERDYITGGDWIYRHADDRPWDPVNDVYQFEHEYVIHTQKRHKTPKLRVNSLSSLNKNAEKKKLLIPCTVEESDSSCQGRRRESDSSDYKAPASRSNITVGKGKVSDQALKNLLDPLLQMQKENAVALRNLQQQITRLQAQQVGGNGGMGVGKEWVTLAIIFIFQIILQWIFR
ncbi:oxysterol-binding protein-related protein 8-like isoform X3 [Pomacea canaliculata]|uniref:oxysterol-binding protein-related protein 8-like isoform X3 n=1 Tax=Pomacea canaliculata TaxID=400727 RepID=UPI000D730C3E|nr:oxysterol-binding protein-related protein 8-like isoform X3 [Pomacea canaliculata]